MTRIYMDHGGASPLRPEAREAIVRAAATAGNPSSLHAVGRLARRELDLAMEAVRALVATPKADVVFTGSGAEANVLGIIGMAWYRNGGQPARWRGVDSASMPMSASGGPPISALVSASVPASVSPLAGDVLAAARGRRALARPRLLVGPDESPSVLRAVAELTRHGFVRGALYDSELSDDVALIILGLEEASTGRRNDTYAIAREAERLGIPLHVDAVRAASIWPIDLVRSGATTMAISSETLGGPHGAGALVKLKGTELTPLWLGGGQEAGLRSGSQAVLLIAGFGAAAAATVMARPAEHDLDQIWVGLGLTPTGAGVAASDLRARLPNISSVGLADAAADRLVELASDRGVMLGRVPGGVRATAGWSTTSEDVEGARLALASCVRELQKAGAHSSVVRAQVS